MRRDQRSAKARSYRHLYNTREWRQARTAQLARVPLCERCTSLGRVTAADTVNHRIRHEGNWALFLDPENLESLCAACHDGERQSQERTGRRYDRAVGVDGRPVDPQHPWYQTETG